MPRDPIILVDDVLTTGGHVKACAAYIADKGGDLLLTVCGGRAVHSQRPNPFEVSTEEIEEFQA